MGRSGAEKSTLVKTNYCVFDVDGGAILIDNQNISDVTQETYANKSAWSPKIPHYYHRTVRENIAYGRPDATDDSNHQRRQTSACVGVYPTFKRCQRQCRLDTQVGERGVKLSGGQRQRIAIARVMLKTPRFCCLMKRLRHSIPKWNTPSLTALTI